MPVGLPGLLAVVGCALAFSALDLVRKALAHRMRPLPLLFYLSLGQVPLFLAWKEAAGAAGGVTLGYAVPGGASVVLNIFANLAFLESVRISPLSLTIPFLSLTPVFAALLAIPLVGELPAPGAALGILLVVVGAFRLSVERGGGGGPAAVWRAFRRERGSVLMVGVALLWSLAMPLDKLAMERSSPAFHGMVLNGGVALGVLAIVVAQRRDLAVDGLRGSLGLFGAAIAASALALGLQLVALGLVWVSFVETLKRAIGSLMAIASGFVFFGEAITAQKVFAVLLMGAGVALILL